MFKLFRKWWNYLTAKLSGSFEAHADPKVQLEQAITEAKTQHVRLKEQATNVIANQKQAELRLNKQMGELEKRNANARQALKMADDAAKAGNGDKAAQFNATAETLATQLLQVEKDVESQKSLVLEAARASDQAKDAVEQNARLLQQKLGEQSKLLSQLDQAKMQEEMNAAMASLNEAVGSDVPTFAEVEQKIQARYSRARAAAELSDTSVESRIREVEAATANVEAQSRLEAMRAELGLTAGAAAAAELPTTDPATGPEPEPEPASDPEPAPGSGATPS
jgi:phage shock protein A